LRRELFPSSPVGAHVTLFHALPPDQPVVAEVAAVADRPGFDIRVSEVMSLGRGAAYRISSAELAAVHAALRARFADVLTRQDAQPYRPHVTVQNKVDPAVARETVARLRAGFSPYPVPATGLAVWRYVGGPWESVAECPFRE
jgi:2'-5' RNA ligase